ncbi:hypothetical protein ACHHYP_03441 [Achlya hypogyna]|uniref:Uncharacterized protein n=1 Tax=Achlya hypogyna TaxID=1202772 RepID=A0A1V9ZR84_ACHHY|nr:hypothetical protein ACHHYP_03441 [Achlya hypogyna]
MPEKALSKDQAVKAFWMCVIKQDLAGIESLLVRYRVHLPPDLRYPPILYCTALHVAVQKNSEAMASLFLRQGVGINAQNKAGATALHLACRLGHTSMVMLLLRNNADYAILDNQMHSPFEVAPWPVIQDALLTPLQIQASALVASEAHAQQDHISLQDELARVATELEGLTMEWEDIQSQGVEEAAAYEAQANIEDALRTELIALKRTLKKNEVDMQLKMERGNEQYKALQDVLERYRHALGLAQDATSELHHQEDLLRAAYDVKSAESTIYSDKLGVLDAMAGVPNDTRVQLWGSFMLASLTHGIDARGILRTRQLVDESSSETHALLLKQHMLRIVRDTMERFPYHSKIQEYAIDAIASLCDALPMACELCMQERYIDNIQAARRQFGLDDAFAGHCVYALRALMMPRRPMEQLSQVHLKFTCKFCAEDNAFVVDLLAKTRDSKLVHFNDMLPHVAGLLFVLAKYNARQVFLERDALGLRTVLAILVDGTLDEDTVRNLLGIASLLSLADVKCPEEDTLPSCYISFGLPKVIPLIQKYASNPDVVMWGIRFLRNLADRDVMAKDQVNRSGIEHILTDLIAACASTSMRVSILQLIYVAFVTNYDRSSQVEELSTMVLDGVRDCFVTHQDSIVLQEWALKSLVVACRHPSNLAYLMRSGVALEVCLMDILHAYTSAGPDAYDPRRSNTVVLWGLRFLLIYYEHEAPNDGLHDLANTHGVCTVLLTFERVCDKNHDATTATIANLLAVLRKLIRCTCRAHQYTMH